MNIKFLKTKYKFLMWCMEDYTSLFSLMCFVKEFYEYNDVNLLKITALEIVQDMLEEGFIDVGLLNNENTFEPSDKDITEVLKEVIFQWDNLDRPILPHEIAWFNVTIKGIIEYERLRSIPEVIEVDSFYLDSNKYNIIVVNI